MVMFCSRPVPRSLAETFTTPLTSMSKVTSIWGLEEKPARMPPSLNLPRDLLSLAKRRSPCRTLISTEVCMGRAVVKIWLLRVGIMLLRVMRGVATPPSVSMDRVRGVTSISTRPWAAAPVAPASLPPPCKRPPWMAAPMATHSSGLRVWLGSWPSSSLTWRATAGIRVLPPTSSTRPRSAAERPASRRALFTGSTVRASRSAVIISNWGRVRVASMWWGPSRPTAIKGRLIWAEGALDSSFLAFSASSFRRPMAAGSFVRSMRSLFLNSCTSQSTIRPSKSSPPSRVSPPVASTVKVPSSISMMETSKVPPPRS